MPFMTEIVVVSFIFVCFVYQAKTVAKHRRKLRDRANENFRSEIELSTDELESRVFEVELMYEELEGTYWAHVSALAGALSYLYWDIWYLSLIVFILLWFIGERFLTLKPFKMGITD